MTDQELDWLFRDVRELMWLARRINPALVHVNTSLARIPVPHMARIDCGCWASKEERDSERTASGTG